MADTSGFEASTKGILGITPKQSRLEPGTIRVSLAIDIGGGTEGMKFGYERTGLRTDGVAYIPQECMDLLNIIANLIAWASAPGTANVPDGTKASL